MAAGEIPRFVNRVWAFVQREWPLSLVTIFSLCIIADYNTLPERITGAVGLLGALFCLRQFGLSSSMWIYLLTMLLVFLSGISIEEAESLQSYWHLYNFEVPFIRFIVNALKGMLYAIPFSLFFVWKLRRFSALLQVPLSVFFLILSLRPLWLGLDVAILLLFVPYP